MRLTLASGAVALVVSLAGATAAAEPGTATGVVFHDRNRDGARDPGEPGLPGVRVSNGREIVQTDAGGRYQLPVEDDTILFVIKPRDWMTPVDALNLPRFYYLHKPAGSPKLHYPGVAPTGSLPASVEFPLYQHPEPARFEVLLFGDTQVRNLEEIGYLAHDVVEQVIGTSAAFGFSLGDLVYDRPDLFGPLNEVIARVGVPFYNVLGNHDENYDAADDRHADETFERHYGPSYYSFDYGPVHFIVLDNVIWHAATEDKKAHYTAGLGPRQMEFVRNDLALLPPEQLVVLTMHIPLIELAERKELFQLLAQHPHTVSFSAHYHIQRHWFLDAEDDWPAATPHHLVALVTACGSWWSGAPDELGIPHTTMADGAPNGWTVATFDGASYSLRYQAARRPASYQMNIYTPDAVSVDQADQTEVLVNVFAGSERCKVETRVDNGDWVQLEHAAVADPYFAALKKAEKSDHPPRGRKLPGVGKSAHIWRGRLPITKPSPGAHRIEVRARDMFGQTYMGRRIIRIE